MKITTVTRHREHKINLGNYESLGLGASATAEVEEGDDIEEVTKDLDSVLDTLLDKPIERVLKLQDEHQQISESHAWGFYGYE